MVDLSVLAGAWLVMAMRVVTSGAGFDGVTYTTPGSVTTHEAWRHGRLALWSDTIFGGTPHLGNLQTGAMYPFHLLSMPFTDVLGEHVETAAHLLLLGAGMYLLGRRLGFDRPAPLAMAVAAMWSGATIVRSTLVVHMLPLSWAPLCMVLIHSVVTSTRPRRAAAGLGLAAWCLFASGHPQSVLMAGTLLAGWAVGLVLQHRAWARIVWLAAAGGITMLVAAPLLFAVRQSLRAAAATTRDDAAVQAPGFIVPVREFPRILLGEPFSGLDHLFGDMERITYAGVVVVALACVGIADAVRRRTWSLLVLAATGLFAASLSVGLRSPTLRFARAFIPGFDQPRVSARWNWVLVVTLIVLAGAGIDRLRRQPSRVDAVAVGAPLVVLLLLSQGWLAETDSRNLVLWCAVGILVCALAIVTHPRARFALACVVAALGVFELAVPITAVTERGAVTTSTREYESPAAQWLSTQPGLALAIVDESLDERFLVAAMRPNANTLYGVRSIDGYDGGVAVSRRWHAGLLQLIPTVNDLTFRAQAPVVLEPQPLARLGVRFVFFNSSRGDGSANFPGWRLVQTDGEFEVYENPLWLGDAVAWYQTRLVGTPEDAGNTLRNESGELADVGLVERESAVLECSGACAPDGFITESPIDGTRSVTVQLSKPAVVAVHEQFDEGWTITVDGEPAPAVAVDGIWTGVRVPAGTHRVRLEYRPGWLTLSLLLMVVGLLAVGLWWWPGGPRIASGGDLHALPERVAAGDLGGGFLRRRVEPRGIGVELAVDGDVLVAGGALPRAGGVAG